MIHNKNYHTIGNNFKAKKGQIIAFRIVNTYKTIIYNIKIVPSLFTVPRAIPVHGVLICFFFVTGQRHCC